MAHFDTDNSPSTSAAAASSPPSSNEDSDLELEPGEYERKRELYWSKVLFCERKFQELRSTYSKVRMDQLEKSQNDILNQRSEVYLTRKGALDAEFQRKREQNKVLRVLRLEALRRRSEADRLNAVGCANDAKKRAAEDIEAAAKEREERQREIKRITTLSFASPDAQLTNTPNTATAIKRDISSYWLNHDAEEEPEEMLWKNVPVILARLPKHSIKEDLAFIGVSNNLIV